MRTNILYILAGLAWLKPVLSQTTNPEQVDVAVIGAGLSGLAAARKLLDAGKSVRVIEARNRVGGRVENAQLANGGVTELGAAFVGPTQDHVLALAEELGLDVFKEYNEGNNLAFVGDQKLPYATSSPVPPLDPLSVIQLVAAIAKLDLLAATIDVNKPWSNLLAPLWDQTTLRQLRDAVVKTQDARDVFEVSAEAIWSAGSDEISLLYALSYIAGAGNATAKGTFERLISTADGGQDSRISGGTGLLAEGLANKVGRSNITLSSPVETIAKQRSGKYLVSGNGTSILASRVIVAMSPPVAGKIKYSPALPQRRQELMKRLFMGSIGKANAVYATPFWRDAGLSGQVVSTAGIVQTTFDASDKNGTYGAILGFIEADQMRELDNATEAEIISKVTQDYVRYFGEQARDIEEWVIKRWDLEEFSRGGPTALAGKGTFRKYGPALREVSGGIHWAGTEASDYWPGFMDGALRSGERAAQEILVAK